MFKNFNSKSLIVGFILGTTFFVSANVLANQRISEKITVVYDNIRIHLNGSEIKNMDVEPFVYNGRTFVPIRFVSEELGLSVNWDNDNKIVKLSNSPIQKENNLSHTIDDIKIEYFLNDKPHPQGNGYIAIGSIWYRYKFLNFRTSTFKNEGKEIDSNIYDLLTDEDISNRKTLISKIQTKHINSRNYVTLDYYMEVIYPSIMIYINDNPQHAVQ